MNRGLKSVLICLSALVVMTGTVRLVGYLPKDIANQSKTFLDKLAKNSLVAYGETSKLITFDSCSTEGLRWSLDTEIVNVVADAARQHSLDQELVFAVIHAESRFKKNAVSQRGAKGLMQLMPATATWLGVKNPYSVRENVFAGTRYLSYLLDKFEGDLELALAAYNAGPGNVARYNNRIPPFRETRAYVKKVVCSYKTLRAQALDA